MAFQIFSKVKNGFVESAFVQCNIFSFIKCCSIDLFGNSWSSKIFISDRVQLEVCASPCGKQYTVHVKLFNMWHLIQQIHRSHRPYSIFSHLPCQMSTDRKNVKNITYKGSTYNVKLQAISHLFRLWNLPKYHTS